MKMKPMGQLYHQFLKPKGLSKDLTTELFKRLCDAKFISNALESRYVENSKMTDELNKNELFKIIEGLK